MVTRDPWGLRDEHGREAYLVHGLNDLNFEAELRRRSLNYRLLRDGIVLPYKP